MRLIDTWQVNNWIADNLDLVLEHFDIKLHYIGKALKGRCPIHEGSDNNTAFTLYPNPGTQIRWICHTHNCHEKYNGDGVGLIRGLTHKTINQAIKYIQKEFGVTFKELTDDEYINRQLNNIYNQKVIQPKLKISDKIFSENYVRNKLKMPASYLIDRGFDAKVLDAYNIGLALTGPMKSRVIIPIEDENSKIIGFTGRSTNNEEPKWINSQFDKNKYLFNFNRASTEINQKGSIIIVEGALDALRLIQFGIKNVVATLCASLSNEQYYLLHQANINKVFVLSDNDDGGEKLWQSIESKLKNCYNLKRLTLPKGIKDPGELTIENINGLFEQI